MRVTFKGAPPAQQQAAMFEQLLSFNRKLLVTVHRGAMTKITPVEGAAVCADVRRPPDGLRDNGVMFEKLFESGFGEYLVTVCYGKIVAVERVEKEAAVKVQDVVEPPDTAPPPDRDPPKKTTRRSTKTKAPAS